jgi:uncharacterized membrane protein YeaQ/YmgE (transglycosylase-associated protein family)
MGIVVFIIVGAIAGFVASKVLTGKGMGLIWDIVVGILGAFVGRLPASSACLWLQARSRSADSWPRSSERSSSWSFSEP